jgi:hypothetical protein
MLNRRELYGQGGRVLRKILLLIFLLLLPITAYSQPINPFLSWESIDGSTESYPYKIITDFTDNGDGTITLDSFGNISVDGLCSRGNISVAGYYYGDGSELTGIPKAIHFTIDGGGSAISTGAKGWVRVPFAMTITGVELTADTSTTSVIDCWVDSYSNFPPDNSDTITGGNEPTITASTKSQDTTLTDWTTSISAGDYVKINVDSNDNATKLYLTLYGTIQ